MISENGANLSRSLETFCKSYGLVNDPSSVSGRGPRTLLNRFNRATSVFELGRRLLRQRLFYVADLFGAHEEYLGTVVIPDRPTEKRAYVTLTAEVAPFRSPGGLASTLTR